MIRMIIGASPNSFRYQTIKSKLPNESQMFIDLQRDEKIVIEFIQS